MRKMNLKDIVNMSEDRFESCYAVNLDNGRVKLMADLEENNNYISPGYDGYRIEVFTERYVDMSECNDIMPWENALENDGYCNAINYERETEKDSMSEIPPVLALGAYAKTETFISITQQEFYNVYKLLKDGTYVICFLL